MKPGEATPGRDNCLSFLQFELFGHTGLPFVTRTSPLAVFGMDVADDHPGGDGGDDDQ
jgi:hypothetical protein